MSSQAAAIASREVPTMTLHALWAAPGPARIPNPLFRFLSIHSKGTPLPQEQWGGPWEPGMEGCGALTAPRLWETHRKWQIQVLEGPGMGDSVGLCDPSASLGSPQHPTSDGSGKVDPSPIQEGCISSWDTAVGLAHNCCPFSPHPACGMLWRFLGGSLLTFSYKTCISYP